MVRYIFKLKTPDSTQKKGCNDTEYGIMLTYSVKVAYSFNLFGNKYITYMVKYLGKKTFLRPYKKYWDKGRYYLPHPYWGKVGAKMLRMWVIIDPSNLITKNRITPVASLRYNKVEIFGQVFNSKQLASYLYNGSRKFSIIK